jgi:hypothetical protein
MEKTIRWRDARIEVPKDDDNVLAICTGQTDYASYLDYYMIVQYFDDTCEFVMSEYPYEVVEVSWWCELPDAPESEFSDAQTSDR